MGKCLTLPRIKEYKTSGSYFFSPKNYKDRIDQTDGKVGK
jgi:hypothetical protein